MNKEQRQRLLARERFVQARRVEVNFERQLRSVARQIGLLVRGFAPKGVVEDMGSLQTALERYSVTLQPWALAVVQRMQSQVSQKDVHAWELLAKSVGRSVRKEISSSPVGLSMRNYLVTQAQLITSLPLDAALRIRELTLREVAHGTRSKEIQKEVLRSGEVALGRAKTIARTEVARTASELTRVRAEHIGSEGYFWRTSGDTDVRKIHEQLEGQFIPWNKPPIAGERGERAHAGQIYNCRCWPEPVLPDVIQ